MPSFADLTLQTARLLLRAPVPADADAVFALRSDPVVQRYGSHPPWTDPQAAVDWIVGGEVCDSLIYGLLAADWKARR